MLPFLFFFVTLPEHHAREIRCHLPPLRGPSPASYNHQDVPFPDFKEALIMGKDKNAAWALVIITTQQYISIVTFMYCVRYSFCITD